MIVAVWIHVYVDGMSFIGIGDEDGVRFGSVCMLAKRVTCAQSGRERCEERRSISSGRRAIGQLFADHPQVNLGCF